MGQRVSIALYKAGLLKRDGKPGKIIIITSQAGSAEWRFTQNPTPKPGFNRTAMTQKYAHIWDIEGAVEPHIGCKRVLYESIKASLETTGTVINCEDGLMIPW